MTTVKIILQIKWKEFLDKYERKLFEIAEIIKVRDIKTDEAKSILRKMQEN